MSTLKDLTQVIFISGKGGDGAMRFGLYKHPEGGDGGIGGNIYIVGKPHLYDFRHIKRDTVIKSEDGERGGKSNMTGKNGKDLFFEVPITTKVFNENGRLILTVDKYNEPKLLAEGGVGGFGNYYFRAGQAFTLEKTTPGKPGKELHVKLELNIKADIIFIGYPNAGKSSILNELTNANSRIAPYAFTTVDPVLGTMDNGTVLMDLPGLIEGTFEGRGLGTRFLKHAETAQKMAHFVSLESEDPIKDYDTMREEVKKISKKLYDLPEIIILTKSDLADKAKVDKIAKKFKKNHEVFVTSAYDYDSIQKLKATL